MSVRRWKDGVGLRLSGRELEVLTLAARGMRDSQIAAELCVAETTVKSHLRHVYDKWGARNRTEAAVLLAVRGEDWDGG